MDQLDRCNPEQIASRGVVSLTLSPRLKTFEESFPKAEGKGALEHTEQQQVYTLTNVKNAPLLRASPRMPRTEASI